MTPAVTALVRLSIAAAIGGAALFWNGNMPLTQQASLVSSAEARIGRPATPRSFAGVAQRTDRPVTRRVMAGTAVGAAAVAVAGAAIAAPPAAAATTTATAATPAQQPNQAQIDAIRSACRADYPAYCAGVPTGGAAALQCLQKNVASLSPACQTAVSAAGGGAAAQSSAAVSPSTTAPAAVDPPAAAPPAPPAAPTRAHDAAPGIGRSSSCLRV